MTALLPMRDIIDGMEAAVAARDELWARTRLLARLIPPETDLGDPCRVALALLAARCRTRDLADVFDSVMALARAERLSGGTKVKEIVTTVFEAFDGRRFAEKDECRSYEDTNLVLRFVGLTAEQIVAAFDRTDTDLSDAFERAGIIIRTLRYQQGDYRSRRGSAPKGELPPSMRDDIGPSITDELSESEMS